MRQVKTVFQFTFLDAVRKKAFILSTVIMLVLILVLCLIPRIISVFEDDQGDNTEYTEESGDTAASGEDMAGGAVCYYIDEEALIPSGLTALQNTLLTTTVKPGAADRLEQYREEIDGDGNISAIEVRSQDGRPFVNVICKDFMSGIPTGDAVDALTEAYTQGLLAAQGMDEATIAAVTTPLSYNEEMTGSLDVTGYALGIVITMLMFFAIYYYGYGVAMSVATEKTSRVMETLIVSAKPSRILLGKCLAMGTLGLIQFGGIILYAVLCFRLFIPEGFTIMGATLSLSSITPYTAAFLIAYFILGYALYAMLNAVCGATVSKVEDVNSALMPVSLIAMVSFYLGYFTTISTSSNGLMQKIALYLPFSSPFMVPSRLLNGGLETWEMLVSLVILAISIVILALISMKLYSASVLHYGNRLKWGEMLKKGNR